MATAAPRSTGPYEGLLDWLAGRHVEHDVHAHPTTFTAEATARAEHVDPRQFAKVVGVGTPDGRRALLVVDAPDHIDLAKARHVLEARDVRVLTEGELRELNPECEVGTVPPIPDLAGVPVYADLAVREDPEISFHAGSHRFTVHVERSAWERAAGIVYADLAQTRDIPPWAR
jgi:Ala-tRNA(Pro) deacylase